MAESLLPVLPIMDISQEENSYVIIQLLLILVFNKKKKLTAGIHNRFISIVQELQKAFVFLLRAIK